SWPGLRRPPASGPTPASRRRSHRPGTWPAPVSTDGQQGDCQKERSNRLVAAAEEEDRPAGRVALAVRRGHWMSSEAWSYLLLLIVILILILWVFAPKKRRRLRVRLRLRV